MRGQERKVFRTDYHHIVKVAGIYGGEAIIKDTRIAVWHVVEYYYKLGISVEEIVMEWNHLNHAQVFSALAYYHDNKKEVETAIERNSYDYWKEHYADAYNQFSEATFEREPIATFSR